jgi:hypothetical protein
VLEADFVDADCFAGPRGPIVLQHHGDPVQFANLFIRELK